VGQKGLLDESFAERIRDSRLLSEVSYEAIREAIGAGRLRPGDWLVPRMLGQELGVSEITVREALQRLSAAGLVEAEPHKGFRVVTLPLEELEDAYELRAVLEGMAMELAAGRLSDEQLARMRELLPSSSLSLALPEHEDDPATNYEFHWIAIKACGRRHLIRILEQLFDLANPWTLSQQAGPELLEVWAKVDREGHEALLEALEARDGARARQCGVESVMANLPFIRKVLQKSS